MEAEKHNRSWGHSRERRIRRIGKDREGIVIVA
jgi:hypothetical protein